MMGILVPNRDQLAEMQPAGPLLPPFLRRALRALFRR